MRQGLAFRAVAYANNNFDVQVNVGMDQTMFPSHLADLSAKK